MISTPASSAARKPRIDNATMSSLTSVGACHAGSGSTGYTELSWTVGMKQKHAVQKAVSQKSGSGKAQPDER